MEMVLLVNLLPQGMILILYSCLMKMMILIRMILDQGVCTFIYLLDLWCFEKANHFCLIGLRNRNRDSSGEEEEVKKRCTECDYIP